MVVLLFGPPGSGKGTQAQRITRAMGIPAISTGDMLRAESEAGTELGKTVKGLLAAGLLVNDDLVNRMMIARVTRPDCQEGFLLDGYPRTVLQAQFLDRFLAEIGFGEPVVLHLEVPDSVIRSRMAGRLQCAACGRVYNSGGGFVVARCQGCGTVLSRRADDRDEVVVQRLRAYHAWTRPVVDHYAARAYHHIDGTRSPDAVFADIASILARSGNHKDTPQSP